MKDLLNTHRGINCSHCIKRDITQKTKPRKFTQEYENLKIMHTFINEQLY